MTEKLYGDPEQISMFDKPQLDTSPVGCDTIHESFWYVNPNKSNKKKMSIFNSMKQSLLEAINMEHGKNYRAIYEYNYLISTGQIELAVEYLKANPILFKRNLNLQTSETYPHEDDRFYIPKEYKNMSSEQLKNVKKAWDDYYKDREKIRKAMFGEGEMQHEKNCKI